MIDPADDPIITVNDMRTANYCVRGIKEWFEKRNLSIRHLIDGQIRCSDLEVFNDANGNRLAEIARKRVRESVK